MSPPLDAFNDFTRSRVITFVIGLSATEFHIHAGAISRLSKPLQVLINGEMKEAREGRVVWDDIDDETFVRFIQWAYTNDYKTPEPDVPLDISSSSTQIAPVGGFPTNPEKALYTIMHKTNSARCAKCSGIPDSRIVQGSRTCTKCHRACMTYRCHECDLPIELGSCVRCLAPGSQSHGKIRAFSYCQEWIMHGNHFHPRINMKSNEDYTNVFLSHAKLYVLADKYDIAGLGEESMHRLYLTLRCFAVYKSRLVDILCLAQFVFDNTRDGDSLRSMLLLYCACIAEDLAECAEFESLMQACPDFGRALVLKMAERFD